MVVAVQQAEARSYIPEPKRPRRNWAGRTDEQRAPRVGEEVVQAAVAVERQLRQTAAEEGEN
jgi:hypothetical protein